MRRKVSANTIFNMKSEKSVLYIRAPGGNFPLSRPPEKGASAGVWYPVHGESERIFEKNSRNRLSSGSLCRRHVFSGTCPQQIHNKKKKKKPMAHFIRVILRMGNCEEVTC